MDFILFFFVLITAAMCLSQYLNLEPEIQRDCFLFFNSHIYTKDHLGSADPRLRNPGLKIQMYILGEVKILRRSGRLALSVCLHCTCVYSVAMSLGGLWAPPGVVQKQRSFFFSEAADQP